MNGIFEKLLIPIDDFKFQYCAANQRYVNNDKSISVKRQESGKWKIIWLYNKSLTKKASDLNFDHLKDTRSFITDMEKLPSNIDFKLKREQIIQYKLISPRFPIVNGGCPLDIIRIKHNSFCVSSTHMTNQLYSPFARSLLETQAHYMHGINFLFKNKKEILKNLHSLLSNNLYNFYEMHYYDSGIQQLVEDYEKLKEANSIVTNQSIIPSEARRAWWLMFIKPEIDIEHIF